MKAFLFTLISIFLILPSQSCSVKTKSTKDFATNTVRECISDTIENIDYPVMYIESDIPQGAVLSLSRDDGRFAVFSHPDYEITQEIFHADSWDGAFCHISGKEAENLNPILAGNFPHEKYRCTWTTAGESGTNLWQSIIFYDGSFFYAISVQCPAELAGKYEKDFSDLLSRAALCGI